MFILGTCSLAIAASDDDDTDTSLPDVKYFTPDMDASLTTVSPVLHLINWAAAIFGLYIIARGIWKTLRIVHNSYTGSYESTSVKDIGEKLKPVGLGILIVLFAVTGLWYKVLVFAWTMIVPQVNDGLDEVTKESMAFIKYLS